MENEEAYIAPYYAGDYLTMVEENPDLKFYQPEHQGFNLFVDGCVIPTCAKEKDAAETFINFLLDPEICAQNLDFIGYSVPETEARQYLDPEAGLQPCSLSQPGDSAQRDLLRLPPRGYLSGDGEPVYDRAERLT